MARWAVVSNRGATLLRSVIVVATTARRCKLYDWTAGCGDAPADGAFLHVIERVGVSTVAGAAGTPTALDSADTAAQGFTATVGPFTADPISLSTVMRVPLNQRATFRWLSGPGGEIISPATGGSGIMLGLSSAGSGTPSFDYDLLVEEL